MHTAFTAHSVPSLSVLLLYGIFILPLFDRFWGAYPRKVSKADARKAFAKLNPDATLVEAMLQALDWQKRLPEWTKDGGQFVPYPATWLNARRWEDEPGKAAAAAKPADQVARSPDDTILSEWEQQWQENHRKEIRRRRLQAESDHGR